MRAGREERGAGLAGRAGIQQAAGQGEPPRLGSQQVAALGTGLFRGEGGACGRALSSPMEKQEAVEVLPSSP